MPVDFFPPIFGVLTCLGFVVGLCWFLWSRRRLRAATLSLIFLVAPWPSLYVWMYCRAEIWYSSSAAKGNPEAEFRLGLAHMFYTSGAEFGPADGVALMQRAADAGNARAQMTLACFILSGLEIPPDQNRALALLDRASQSIPDAAVLAREVRNNGFDYDHPSDTEGRIADRWIYGPP